MAQLRAGDARAENLPSFVVMTDPRGGPIGGASNWTAGYMPAAYQGTLFRGKGSPLLDLATPDGHRAPRAQRRDLDLLQVAQPRSIWRPTPARPSWPRGSSRTSWPTRCRRAPPRSSTSTARTAATREMYGLDDDRTRDFGRKCLITRRLLERGVRFIQLYSGGGHLEDTWDGHTDCITNHRPTPARPTSRSPP